MIESELQGDIIVHRFSGQLNLHDLMSIKRFVEQPFLAEGGECGVLWDLLAASDDYLEQSLEQIASFVLNPNTANLSKRAFAIHSNQLRHQLSSVLEGRTIPRPWAVFDSEETARSWLIR